MPLLLLTRNLKVEVDQPDYDWLADYNWVGERVNDCTYGRRRVRVDGKRLDFLLHRMIAGVPKTYRVIFRDGHQENCKRSNLRIEDLSGQQIHWQASTGTSQFAGVEWNQPKGVWTCALGGLPIGAYDNEVDAARAYNATVRRIVGDNAPVNVIPFMSEKEACEVPVESKRRALKESRARGVYRDNTGAWRVWVEQDGQVVDQGPFPSEDEAIAAHTAICLNRGLVERTNA
jgi:hypothetical protein